MEENNIHTKGSKSFTKKCLGWLLGLLGFWAAAAVIVPLVVDVDQYRPVIEKSVNDRIHGQLKIGKMKLSLWGQILIKLDGLDLKDASDKSMLSVKDVYFHLPFSSILKGSPTLTFKMVEPMISAIKDRSGSINWLKLLKKDPPSETPPESKPSTSSSQGPSSIPKMALLAKLGLEIRHSTIAYDDLQSGLSNRIRDLNIRIRDLSLNRKITIEIDALVDTKMKGLINVKGPFRWDTTVDPTFSGADFKNASIQTQINLNDLSVDLPGILQKPAGSVFQVMSQMVLSKQSLELNQFVTRFLSAELTASGRVDQLEGTPEAHVKIETNEIKLSDLGQFFSTGTAGLKASFNGPTNQLAYQIESWIKDLAIAGPGLKAKPILNARVNVVTEKIEPFILTIKAPGNDLEISGKVLSFQKPQIFVQLKSSLLDLDQLIDFPKPKDGGADHTVTTQSQTNTNQTAESDMDAMLEPLRTNPMARSMGLQLSATIKKLKAQGIEISPIELQFKMVDLVAQIQKFYLAVFGGQLNLSSTLDMKPAHPKYMMNVKLVNLDLKKAVESQLKLFKNTVYGKLDYSMNGSGASFNPSSAKKNLDVKGSFKVDQPTFTSIDVGRIMTESLNTSIDKVAEKIPALKGKKLKGLPKGESKYQLISSDFSTNNGLLQAPTFRAKAMPNQGVDIEGDLKLGLIDQKIDANWRMIDTYNLTQARDLNADIAGHTVEHVLAKGNPPVVSFPIHVGCELSKPCYSYTQVPEYLAKVALENTSNAIKNEAKQKATKAAEKAVDQATKNAPKPVQDAIKKFKGKFF